MFCCSVVFGETWRLLSQPRLTDVLRFVVPLPRSTNAAAYATSDECHQLTTVRRHSVYNTWRSHRWQHTVKRDISRNRYFSTLPLVGRSWNIAVNFLMEELEWRSYQTVRNFLRTSLFVSTEYMNVTGRGTDGHRIAPRTAYSRAYA